MTDQSPVTTEASQGSGSTDGSRRPQVGVLALQGAFALHVEAMTRCGADAFEVRTAEQLAQCDALILPGGESTTMTMLLERSGLRTPLEDRLAGGMAVFATCAGMILLADQIADGRPDQKPLQAIDLDVRRNGYGRQVDSFEADIDILGLPCRDTDGTFRAVFIRAPVVTRHGPGVEVMAQVDDNPVLCRQGAVLAASFHPELANDDRLHRLFLDQVVSAG